MTTSTRIFLNINFFGGLKFFLEIFIIVLGISGGPPTAYQKFSRGDTVPLSFFHIKVLPEEQKVQKKIF